MSEATEEKEIEEEGESKSSFSRYMMLGVGGLFLLILLTFLAGVGVAIWGDPQDIAPRIGIIRDTLLIIMVFEGIAIIFALVALVLQVTRLIVMLRNDVQPILSNAQETSEIAKGTVQFVGKNVTKPILDAKSFAFATATFVREIGGIRRAIRPSKKAVDSEDSDA